jgi:hypothetical protein
MYGLIRELYNEKKQKQFESLYTESDSSTQFLLRAQLAKSLKDCPRLLMSHGTDWILCALSTHNKSEEDTVRVFASVVRKLHKIEFGLLTNSIQWRETNDVADSCLVGISFFRKRMELMNRRGAPSVDYYMKAGSLAFQRLGYENIGTEFADWVDFIEDEFAYAME